MKRLLSIILVISLCSISYSANLDTDKELKFDVVQHDDLNIVDEYIWRGTGEEIEVVDATVINLVDYRGNTIGTYSEKWDVGEPIPTKLFEEASRYYTTPCLIMKYESSSYSKTTPFFTDSMMNKYLTVKALNEIELLYNTDFTIENLNDGKNGKYIKLKDSSISLSDFNKVIITVNGGDIPTSDGWTCLSSHCGTKNVSTYVKEQYNFNNTKNIDVMWTNPKGTVELSNPNGINIHANCENQSSYTTCAGKNWFYTGYEAPSNRATYKYWSYNCRFSINIPKILCKNE